MKYRKLCNEQVSILGFGAMRFPTLNEDTKQIDVTKSEEMLDYAIEHGINYIDTAYPYHGEESERFLGNYFNKRKNREKVFLATKLPIWKLEKPEDCEKIFQEQLQKLQTDHFDFYLLHALNEKSWQKVKELKVLECCEKMLAKDKIKHLGFSFHDRYPVFKKIVDGYDRWDFCQIQYNYMDTRFQAGRNGLKYARKNGLDVIIMEPLRGGQLCKEPPKEIARIWEKFPVKRDYADAALQWLWDHPEIPLVLSGMSTIQQLKENITSANEAAVDSLTEKEIKLFNRIRRTYHKRSPFMCTTCKYCEPCPEGVAISSILGFYMNYVIYDDLKRNQMFYNKFLKPEKHADKCVKCGKCEEKCPQDIPIMSWLEKAHKALFVQK